RPAVRHRRAALADPELLLLDADAELGGRLAPGAEVGHEIVDGQGHGGRRLADVPRASNSSARGPVSPRIEGSDDFGTLTDPFTLHTPEWSVPRRPAVYWDPLFR